MPCQAAGCLQADAQIPARPPPGWVTSGTPNTKTTSPRPEPQSGVFPRDWGVQGQHCLYSFPVCSADRQATPSCSGQAEKPSPGSLET